MRIAAGVLLIIAAIFNLFASLGYLLGGAASHSLSNAQYYNQENVELANAVSNASILLSVLGLFLLVSVGVLITGAVLLFRNSMHKFIIAAGLMAIFAEIFGIMISDFGVMNIIGLVAGCFTLYAFKADSSPSIDGFDEAE